MNVEFYLFDVNHGQSAALRLPNSRWCLFDLGRSHELSPVHWIAENERRRSQHQIDILAGRRFEFSFYKTTVSHGRNRSSVIGYLAHKKLRGLQE